ncbi:MAG: class I SAM-dependent methyltransferase [Nitrospiraceae bacterium]
MCWIAWFVRLAARGLDSLGHMFQSIASVLYSLLPALLPPSHLSRLIARHYDVSYQDNINEFTPELFEWDLDQWEQHALDRHRIERGRILVLGAGVGREAVALARRGLSVTGIDVNHVALRTARRVASTAHVQAQFIQADFLRLPCRPRSFDYVMLSGIMYSAIPGRELRQAWVRDLIASLPSRGLAILNFMIDQRSSTRTQRLSGILTAVIMRLPGANRTFQMGDTCAQAHFLHAFQNEQELRQELTIDGVLIRELNWRERYAVVTCKTTSRE